MLNNKAKKILVIDDNADDLEACTRALNRSDSENYIVLSANTPSKGLELLDKVDCVIIDFHFPGITGFELLERIKTARPHLPVIVLTGQVDETAAVRLLKLGASEYLNKNALLSTEFSAKVASVVAASEQPDEPISADNSLRILIVDDNPDDIEYCKRLLQKSQVEYCISTTTDSHSILSMAANNLDCVLLDYSLPEKSGLELLQELMIFNPFIAVILITGQGSERIAVEAIKRGAENYLIKTGLTANLLSKTIRQAVDKKRLEKHLWQKEQTLQEREAELQDANSFLNLILESMPDLLFVKDEQSRLVKVNSKFLQLYPEQQRHEIIGHTTAESYDSQEAEAFLAMDRKAFGEGSSQAYECITFPNGDVRTLFTVKTRFTNSKNENFILGVAHDVTEREALISQLSQSNNELEQFAYVASHDLKAPLSAISKVVSWLQEDFAGQFPQEAKAHFDLIRGRTQRMSKLLEDLLQYSRVQRKLKDNEPIVLNEMKRELLDLIDNDKSVRLNIVGEQVVLPRIALKIVLTNLLSNAVKHHDRESVNIEVCVHEEASNYRIRVVDDGPGIAAEYSQRIFQMFQTLKPRDEVEGSGMGLAMVKKIIEYYGGKITLSEPGERGAAFEIIWPKNSKREHSVSALQKGEELLNEQ